MATDSAHMMKRHDLDPVLRVLVKQRNGKPFDLTGYTQVRFIMRAAAGGTIKVNATAVIEDAAAGAVRYDWITADTDTAGTYVGEIEAISAGSRKRTFPTRGYLSIVIEPDLNNA